ncbi:uncharacterized protein METZ01_LOCUS17535 [marine metagenome]|uniref:4-(cytidine 5'-diphospho)-2-C-methyl-D-erythritol kinase n=1 Tax=marine metagenome TaxID=408172 RepID=A0A381PCG4_9ZZZZ
MLDHGDTLEFETAELGTLSLHLSDGPFSGKVPMDSNLVLKAAHALRKFTGRTNLGARIGLTKHIPLGAGLGGGSSDAAATLQALNALWQLELSLDQLLEIGTNLGADIPVFLTGRTAWGEGIGDQLHPVELETTWYLVVTPACEVSSAEIFSHEQLTRNSSAIKIADFLAGRARNDCEPITRKLYPAVDQALNILNRFGEAKMTGTGSSIFLAFPDETSAKDVDAKLPDGLQRFVAQGINAQSEGFFND